MEFIWTEPNDNVEIAGEFLDNWQTRVPLEKVGNVFKKKLVI